jgi:outer membrane protein TolC
VSAHRRGAPAPRAPAAVLLASLLAVGTATAQRPPAAGEPAISRGVEESLRATVEEALEKSLPVRLATLDVRRAGGTVERLRGGFDPRLSLGLDLAFQRLALLGAAGDLPTLADEAARAPSGGADRIASQALAPAVEPAAAAPEALATAASSLPADQDSFELRLRGGWSRRLRSGLEVGPRAELALFDEDFVSGVVAGTAVELPTLFRSTLALDVAVPLRRGRGEEEVWAAVRAAELEQRAEAESLRHTASEVAFSVVDAYWRLAAAVERLGLLERSRDLGAEILRIGEGLVRADQVPRAALAATRARAAQVEAQVARARASVVTLRFDLGRAIGREMVGVERAPRPLEPLPPVPERIGVHGSLDDLFSAAIARRGDLQALELRRQAARVRAEAARLAQRRRLDLSASVGWQGLAEGGGWAEGLADALAGGAGGPAVNVGVELELPSGNRQRRGEELEARSVASGALVTSRERERQVRNRAVSLLDRLAAAALEAGRRGETVEHYRASIDATRARLANGDATLIDLITTEEQLTEAELAALDAREEHARVLARLQFELGALVDLEVAGEEVRLTTLSAGRLAF